MSEFNTEIFYRYGTDEMSKVLCNLAMENPDADIIAECDEAIYEVLQLGKHGNRHYLMTLFRVLEILTHKHEDIIFKEE